MHSPGTEFLNRMRYLLCKWVRKCRMILQSPVVQTPVTGGPILPGQFVKLAFPFPSRSGQQETRRRRTFRVYATPTLFRHSHLSSRSPLRHVFPPAKKRAGAAGAADAPEARASMYTWRILITTTTYSAPLPRFANVPARRPRLGVSRRCTCRWLMPLAHLCPSLTTNEAAKR